MQKSSTDGLSCMNLTGLFFLKEGRPRLMEHPVVDEVVTHRCCQRLYCLSWKTRKKQKDQNNPSYMLWGQLGHWTQQQPYGKCVYGRACYSWFKYGSSFVTGHPGFKVELHSKIHHIVTIWHMTQFAICNFSFCWVVFFIAFHLQPNHIIKFICNFALSLTPVKLESMIYLPEWHIYHITKQKIHPLRFGYWIWPHCD